MKPGIKKFEDLDKMHKYIEKCDFAKLIQQKTCITKHRNIQLKNIINKKFLSKIHIVEKYVHMYLRRPEGIFLFFIIAQTRNNPNYYQQNNG